MKEIVLLCESAAVVLVAMFVTRCMRRRSAAERHAVWVAAFVCLLLLPVARFLPLVTTRAAPTMIWIAATKTSSLLLPTAALSSRNWMVEVWLLGATVCLVRIVQGLIRGFLMSRSAKRTGTFQSYDICYSQEVSSPVAWGLGSKRMLLPFSAARWDDTRRAVVLSHEAAHLRRNDSWALLAAELACGLFWCNPLVWIAASRVRREQEHAADDEVLESGADPAEYAGHLVALAKAGRTPLFATGAINQSQLTARVEAILDPRRFRRMPSRAMIITTVLALLVVAFPLASMQADRKVEKIGADVTAPRPIHKEEPKYTEEAREARIEGSVTLSVIIEANGRILEAKVIRSLDPGLDANAVTAVKEWIFEPATKNGQPVAVAANIETNFRLF